MCESRMACTARKVFSIIRTMSRFWVPAGAGPLTIVMQGDLDFDLAVKHGSTILSYAAAAEGGDWEYRDTDASPNAEIVVPSPAEGRWYIDIFDAWTTAEVGSYTLTIR